MKKKPIYAETRAERTKHHDDWIKEFHRFMGDRVAKVLVNTFVTPTQVTIFRFLCAVAASILIFLTEDHSTLLLAGFCMYLFSMLDAADGSLAKMKNIGTKTGAWLDRQADGLGFFIVFLGLSLRFAQSGESESYWIILPFASLAMAFMVKTNRIALIINPKFNKIVRFNVLNRKIIDNNKKESKLNFIGKLKRQAGPDFHKISAIIIIGLITNSIKLSLIILFSFLLFWWIFRTIQVLIRAVEFDNKISL